MNNNAKDEQKVKPMAVLTLTGQAAEKADVAPKLVKLKNLMVQRKTMWDKIPHNKRCAWISNAATKDPIVEIAWDVYHWLKVNFFEDIDDADI